MSIYSYHGFNKFLIATGYNTHYIRRRFRDRCSLSGRLTFHLSTGDIESLGGNHPNWLIHVVNTGMNTQTGGCIRRLNSSIGNASLMDPYGDGVGDINIRKLAEFHLSRGKRNTITPVRPPTRYGHLELNGE